jgi:hypothetical protein
MSVYLKVLPAVLLDPDVLLHLGQNICAIVRHSLILDRRMEELCDAIEREGRTLNEVILRNQLTPIHADLDMATIGCERACSLLKAGIQQYLFHDESDYRSSALILHRTIRKVREENQAGGYDISGNRIKVIIDRFSTEKIQTVLTHLDLTHLFHSLKTEYQKFSALLKEFNLLKQSEQLPTLRSTMALYGMLIDTLIANVRFENYQLLHRVESILCQIESVVTEAMETMIERLCETDSAIDSEEAILA